MKTQVEQEEVDRMLRKLRLLHWLFTPIEWALIVLDFLWMAPILALQLVRFVRDPSLTNFLWILAGLVISGLVWRATRLRRVLTQVAGMVRSLLPLQPFKAQYYKLEDFVEKPVLEALKSTLPPESDPVFIKLSRPDSQERIYCPLSAYNMSDAGTFVFTPYGPEEMSAVKQFWILHEVGHGEKQNIKQIERPNMARCTGLFLVLWLLLTTDYSALHSETVVLGVMTLLVILRVKYLSDGRAETRLVDAEVLADNFALIALSAFDVRKLEIDPAAEQARVDAILRDLRDRARRKPSLILPADRSLSIEGAQRRLTKFLANLDSLQAGGGHRVPIVMLAQPWVMLIYIGLFFPLALVPQLTLSATQAWIGIIALGAILLWEGLVLSYRLQTNLGALQKGINDGVFDLNLFVHPKSPRRFEGRASE